jgi:subtilisin family serine protease
LETQQEADMAEQESTARQQPLVSQAVIAEPLTDPIQRAELFPKKTGENDLFPIVVELNLSYRGDLNGARDRFLQLYQLEISKDPREDRRPPQPIASTYVRCDLSIDEVRALVRSDAQAGGSANRSIYRVWPDFPVHPLTDRSVMTIKADAAHRSFAATGRTVVWGVIDSGIDQSHPHFTTHDTLSGDVAPLHKDFTRAAVPAPLTDQYGHGTHVAGIIAGAMPSPRSKKTRVCIGQHTQNEYQQDSIEVRQLDEGATLSGIAPQCKLVSLKVLDDNGDGGSTDVIAALQYVREVVNGNGKMQRIHGVNLSLGYEFDPKWFACGQSPLCVEVDRLVRSGVVVVVAAGNTGYGYLNAEQRQTRTGLTLTINDPGNANLAITVGATHRYMPHVYGVSYFSSKGPTGDGRLKPDLVAPGERITSCAVGQMRDTMPGAPLADNVAAYIDDTGTSMAAPHVSGAIAAFLSIRSEYIGRPEDVKQVFLDSATSLGRERYFEGHGLVDLMRAIQSV